MVMSIVWSGQVMILASFIIFQLIKIAETTCNGDANAYTYMTGCKCNPGYGGSIGSCTSLLSLSCGACCTNFPYFFQCVSGSCIDIAKQMDGTCDCTGCEDEACQYGSVKCNTYSCPAYTMLATACQAAQATVRDLNYCSYTSGFTCTDGSACIPWAWVRDGTSACADGSDETTTQTASLTYADCVNNVTSSSYSYLTSLGLSTTTTCTSCSCTCSYDRTGTSCLYANVIRLKVKVTKFCSFTAPWNSSLSTTTSQSFKDMSAMVMAGLTMIYKAKDTSNIQSVCIAPYPMDPTIYVHIDVMVSTSSSLKATDIANVFSNYMSSASSQMGGYQIYGASLEDENECANSTLNECSTYASCTNTYGSYSCTCNSGYDDIGWIFRSYSVLGNRWGRWCVSGCNGGFRVGGDCIDLYAVIFLCLLLALLLLLLLLLLFWLCCCHAKHYGSGAQQRPNNQPSKQQKHNVKQSNHWAQTDPEKTGDHIITPLQSRPQSASNYYDHARSEPVALRPVSPPPPGAMLLGSPKKTIMRSLTVQTDMEPDRSGKQRPMEPQKHDTPAYNYNYVPRYVHDTRTSGMQTEPRNSSTNDRKKSRHPSTSGDPEYKPGMHRSSNDPNRKPHGERHRHGTHPDGRENARGTDSDPYRRSRSQERPKPNNGDKPHRSNSTDGSNNKPVDTDYQKKKSNRGNKRPPPQWKHWKSVPRELNPVLSNDNY